MQLLAGRSRRLTPGGPDTPALGRDTLDYAKPWPRDASGTTDAGANPFSLAARKGGGAAFVAGRQTVIEQRMLQQFRQAGALEEASAAAGVLLQSLRDDGAGGLYPVIESFFAACRRLAENPASLPLRQNVIDSLRGIEKSFERVSRAAVRLSGELSDSVAQTLDDLARVARELIQTRSVAPRAAGAEGETEAPDVNATWTLVSDLARLGGCTVEFHGERGITVRAAGGTILLAEGGLVFPLSVVTDEGSGARSLTNSQGETSDSFGQAGKVGGLVLAGSELAGRFLSDLERCAVALSTAINQVHSAGFDLSGFPGREVFKLTGKATRDQPMLELLVTRPEQVAASADGSAGDGSNATALGESWDQALLDGQSLPDFLLGWFDRCSTDVLAAGAECAALRRDVGQLEEALTSVTPDALEDEPARLFRLQRALEAAARTTFRVDELTHSGFLAAEDWADPPPQEIGEVETTARAHNR